MDGGSCEWEGRWNHIKKFLERSGPFTHPDFEPSTEVTMSGRGVMLLCVALLISVAHDVFIICQHSPCSLCWKPAKSWSLVLEVWDVSCSKTWYNHCYYDYLDGIIFIFIHVQHFIHFFSFICDSGFIRLSPHSCC